MANYPKYQGQRMVKEDEYAYLQELIEAHEDPSAEWGGASYTAGTGIDITNEEISIDGTVVATKTDLEDYELKADAFSGSYNDLTDKPTIPAAQVQSDWSQSDNTAVDYIKNKPTIPTTATSTSSVTPSTVQLTFTYSDNTTEVITLMTGASVTTTTTLS